MTPDDDPTVGDPAMSSLCSLAQQLARQFGRDAAPDLDLDAASASDGDAAATPPSEKELLAQPRQIRYELRSEIGRGGMGEVFEVWDPDLRRKLALKRQVSPAESARAATPDHHGSRPAMRFKEEAQITAQLDHPGFVPVHEFGIDSCGRMYFTMKRVRGKTLERVFQLVADGADDWNETRALSALLKVCDAMSYAHKKRVIHRDLKPANVMVGDFGEVYVMDLGLARVLGRTDVHDLQIKDLESTRTWSVTTERRDLREREPDSPIVTQGGDILGTPLYMSPEQARNEIDRLGPHSDVYSIGAMIYHLLARQPPYLPSGKRVHAYAILHRLLEGPPMPLEQLRRDVPAELLAICEKAMAREIEQRYPDTLALAEDLRAYLEMRVVAAYETGPIAELRKWVRRNKPLSAAIATTVIVLIVGLFATSTLYVRAANSFELARREKDRADIKARDADAQRTIAERATSDVLSLSDKSNLQNLIRRADDLWPAHPSNIAAYERWIEDARDLIDGRRTDTPGTTTNAGLAWHIERLKELESRASTSVPAKASTVRSANEVELDDMQRWCGRMLGDFPWPDERALAERLRAEWADANSDQLYRAAAAIVEPTGPRWDEDVKALILAQWCIDRAAPKDLWAYRDTLAWSLFRVGRFSEALVAADRALADAPTDYRYQLAEPQVVLREAILDWTVPDRRTRREIEFRAHVARAADDRPAVNSSLPFASATDKWWHAELRDLVDGLKQFIDPVTGPYSHGASAEHGWGVLRRLEFARGLEAMAQVNSPASESWAHAIAVIRDRTICPAYDGLEMRPQTGLVPLGPDRRSGLWEFAHVASGDTPSRDDAGDLRIQPESCVVLVLVPGGTFAMGSQRDDPDEPNYDADAVPEWPRTTVTIDPYFISKYEMTQRQWERMTWDDPSQTTVQIMARPQQTPRRGRVTSMNPVESVSWSECSRVLRWYGLTLPTEAQWERAARAGTTTPWFTGQSWMTLSGAANLLDSWKGRNSAVPGELWRDDGYELHAEVGQLRANAFGLHDVIGNVIEWCKDGHLSYESTPLAGTGERAAGPARDRIARGGSYFHSALESRSAARAWYDLNARSEFIGVRPARLIE